MPCVNDQIVKLFEVEGLDVDSISQCLELDVDAVKIVLAAKSFNYRQKENIKKEPKRFENIIKIAEATVERCMHSEHDFVALNAAKFAINEFEGRNNPIAAVKTIGNVNVLMINKYIQQSKAAVEKARNKIIDVKELQAA